MPPEDNESTAPKRETWLDWLPHTAGPILREEFIVSINEEYETGVTVEQLQSWEDHGILPDPIKGTGYPPNAELIIRTLHRLERDDIPPEMVRRVLRALAKSLDETALLDIRDRLVELQEEAAARRETWVDWLPADWVGPSDEELITRDVLLKRAQTIGVDIHPRTLQILENQGLMPRPVRRWHDGAVRALYAPWVVDLAVRAYERRRDRWPLEDAQADVRDSVKQAIFLYGMDKWVGRGIPIEFMKLLRELADKQTVITGTPINSAEIRFLDAEGRTVATIQQRLGDPERSIKENAS